MYIRGNIHGAEVEWLVDTGCNPTLLSYDAYHRIPLVKRPILQPYLSTLSLADGTPLKVSGKAEFQIEMGGKLVKHTVIVAKFITDGLLGMDFMRDHGLIIDLARDTVSCEGETIPSLIKGQGRRRCARVTVAETVTIPAGKRTIIEGKLPQRVPQGDWLIEPLSKPLGGHPVLLAKTLVTGGKSKVPMEVMNPTQQDLILYKNTNAAVLQPVQLLNDMEPIPVTKDDEAHKTRKLEFVHQVENAPLKPELTKILDEIQYPPQQS